MEGKISLFRRRHLLRSEGNMKVLITGCAGYIGSVLTRHLVQEGYSVTGVDNFMYNNQHAITDLLDKFNFKVHSLDVRWGVGLKDLYQHHDVIIPLAAIVGAPACDKKLADSQAINEHAIKDMMKYLSPNQKVIYPNTNSGYGISGEKRCTEKSPLEPISHYGKTKCAAEVAVLQHPNSVSLRLATVFGLSPRMRFDLMVNDFFAQFYYNSSITLFEPHFKRNFVHVKDVARAFQHMIKSNYTGVFNIGYREMNMTKGDLAHKIAKHLNIPPQLIKTGEGKDPDQRDCIVSTDKIENTYFTFSHWLGEALDNMKAFCEVHTYQEVRKMTNV